MPVFYLMGLFLLSFQTEPTSAFLFTQSRPSHSSNTQAPTTKHPLTTSKLTTAMTTSTTSAGSSKTNYTPNPPTTKSPSAITTKQPVRTSIPLQYPACVCTTDVQIQIRDAPDRHSTTIGYLYQDECKLSANKSTGNFLGVLHYQQVGYVQGGVFTKLVSCPPFFIPDKDDLMVTSSVPPGSSQSSTPSSAQSTPTSTRKSTPTSTQGTPTSTRKSTQTSTQGTPTSTRKSTQTSTQGTPTSTRKSTPTSTQSTPTSTRKSTPESTQGTPTSTRKSTQTSTQGTPTSTRKSTQTSTQGATSTRTNTLTSMKGMQSTLSSTQSNPVTTTATSTPPTTAPGRCDKMAIFTSMSHSASINARLSLQCPDGVHHQSEDVLMMFCAAPLPRFWGKGQQVTTACNSISRYTPVAVFGSEGNVVLAGVFLGCEGSSIDIVVQTCTSNLHIQNILETDVPSSKDYYVVVW